jgi:hypothetical protein
MIRIDGETVGLEESVREMVEDEVDHARGNTRAAAEHIAKEMRKKVDRSGSGRFYGVKGKGLHRGSEPGQPPAKLFGDLQDSIGTKPLKTERGPRFITAGVMVGPGIRKSSPKVAATAVVLEKGGLVGRGRKTRILPRPYVAPTIEQERTRAHRIMER